jgi:tetratricopeptide (TPR) repeat protein
MSTEARLTHAKGLDEAHDLEGAMATYAEIVAATPSHALARSEWARLLVESTRFDEAAEVCREGLSFGSSAVLLAAFSRVHQARLKGDEALEAAQRAVAADPRCGDAWYALATARGLKGDERGAKEAVSDGLDSCPDHPELLAEHATREELSPVDEVLALRDLLDRFPSRRTIHFSHMILLFAAGFEEDAIREGELLTQRCPRNHTALGVHGMHCLIMGDLDRAAHFSDQALALWPDSFFGLFTRFQLQLRADDTDGARATLAEVERLTPDNSLFEVFVIQMMVEIGQLARAEILSRARVQRAPRAVGPRIAMAEVEEAMGRLEAALAEVRTAVALTPRRYDLYAHEARLLVELERYDEAEPLLSDLDPSLENDLLLTRIRAGRATEVPEFISLYEAHLERYPVMDFAWGLLLRHYVEIGRTEEVARLVSPPYDVPFVCHHGALASAYAQGADDARAARHLEALYGVTETPKRWRWSWAFALTAADVAALAPHRAPVTEAALRCGFDPTLE